MSNKNQSDIQLRIIAAIDGLVDISKLITEVDKLGGQTTESSVEVEKLVSDLDKLRQQDQLISQFQQLKKGTADLGSTLDSARIRATSLGKGLADSKAAVASTNSEYKASRLVTQQLSNEWVQAKAKVDLLSTGIKNTAAPTREQRDELKKAREEAKALGEQYRASSKETTTLASALRSTESAVTKQAKEFNSARKEVNQLDAQYQKQNGTLNSLRTTLQQTGVNTKQLVAEQQTLKSATAQAEIGVKGLSEKLREQSSLHKYLKENVDLSGSAFKQNAVESKKLAASHAEASVASNGFASTVSGLTSRLLAMAGAYVGITTITSAIKEMFSQGNQAELLQIQMNAVMGSIQAGEQATAWIQKFAKETPLQLNEVTQAFTTMKSFGLDPMDGSLQMVVDQSFKLGKGFEGVQRISLALGQAWAKQKLQGEEIMQLVEAGVPVWDMLAKATGKNTQELSALSEKGALGRDVIKQLMDEIAKGSSGAAAANMGTLSGLISNAKDNIDSFYRMVADSGSLDWLKQQLQSVNEKFAEMTADGSLKAWAKEISNDIIATGEAIKSTAKTLYEWRDSIATIGKAWAVLKVVSWISNLKSLATGFGSVTAETTKAAMATNIAASSFGKLSSPLKMAIGFVSSLKSNLMILATSWGIEKILNAIDAYNKMRDAQKELEKSQKLQAETAKDLKNKYADISKQTGITITSIEQFDKLIKDGKIHFDELTKSYKAGPEPIKKIGTAVDEANPKLTKFYENINVLKDKLKELEPGSKETSNIVTKMFDEMDINSKKSVSYVIRTLDDLEKKGTITAKNISDGLGGTLKKMSAEDLTKLQKSLSESGKFMDDVGKKSRVAGDMISQELFSRVGINLKEMREGFTEAGKATISVFKEIASSGKFNSAEIKAAFDNSINSAKTVAEVNELKKIYEQAGKTGAIAGNDIASGMAVAEAKMKSLANAAPDVGNKINDIKSKNEALEESFNKLGVTSSAALKKAADEAEANFNVIASGGATIQEQKSAFMVYAQASLTASKAAGELPSPLLESQAAALGLSGALATLKGNLSSSGSAAETASKQYDVFAYNTKRVATGSADVVKSYSVMTPLFKAATLDMSKAASYMSMSISDLNKEIETQDGLIQKLSHSVGVAPDSFGQWIGSINQASIEVYRFYANAARAAKEVQGLQTALAENPSDVLINRAEHALSKYKELGDENLSGLRSAIDSARSKMESLNASTQSTLNSLRDQVDELNNNTAAIENRRYQTEVAELEAKLAEAEKLKNAQSIADMKEALRLAQEIHNQKLATIKAEQAASKQSSSSSKNSSSTSSSADSSSGVSTKTVTVNLKTGSTITPVQVTDESQAAALLSALEKVGLRTA